MALNPARGASRLKHPAREVVDWMNKKITPEVEAAA